MTDKDFSKLNELLELYHAQPGIEARKKMARDVWNTAFQIYGFSRDCANDFCKKHGVDIVVKNVFATTKNG